MLEAQISGCTILIPAVGIMESEVKYACLIKTALRGVIDHQSAYFDELKFAYRSISSMYGACIKEKEIV